MAELDRSRRSAWHFAGLLAFCLVVAIVALAMLTPLRRTVPIVWTYNPVTQTTEVLQSFDNRVVGNQELLNKHWARKYVTAREQYNWWLVATDYDEVAALTDTSIFNEYGATFLGEKGLDKIFGDFTDRRIKILSIAPSPSSANQMVVRFERTTVSRGQVVEAPTTFVANLVFRYKAATYASEAELIRNPMGFQVYSYRRDVEAAATLTPPAVAVHPTTGG